jgi:hypothetical protein
MFGELLAVGIVIGMPNSWRVGGQVLAEARYFSYLHCPYQFWGTPASYSVSTWDYMKLTTHLQLVLRSKYVDLNIQFPIHLHSIVLN